MSLNKTEETLQVKFLYDIRQTQVQTRINEWINENKEKYKIIDIKITLSKGSEWDKDILIIYDII